MCKLSIHPCHKNCRLVLSNFYCRYNVYQRVLRVVNSFETNKPKFKGQKVFFPQVKKRVLNGEGADLNRSPKRSKCQVDDLLDSQQQLDSEFEDLPNGVFSQFSPPPAFGTSPTQPMTQSDDSSSPPLSEKRPSVMFSTTPTTTTTQPMNPSLPPVETHEDTPLTLAQPPAPSSTPEVVPLTQLSDSSAVTDDDVVQKIVSSCQQALQSVYSWSALSEYQRSRLVPLLKNVIFRARYFADQHAPPQDKVI